MRAPGYLPGPLVVPGVVEVILEWALPNGVMAHNVLHGSGTVPGGINIAYCNTLFDAIVADARWTTYADLLNQNTELLRVKVRDLDTPFQGQFESTSAGAPGTGVGGAIPEGVALVTTLKASTSGRASRGRVYLTGFDKTSVNPDGTATGALTAAANGFVQTVSDVLSANFLLLCIANRSFMAYTSPRTGSVVPAGATVGDIIPATHHLVEFILTQDNKFDSQRRRK